jgi:hypothetical protein
MKNIQTDRCIVARKRPGSELPCLTLQDEVNALIQDLRGKANKLNKKRRTCSDRAHWIARGRQRALWRVSAQLHAIEAASLTSYTLYLALQDYLACLDKWCIDVQEERQTRGPRNGLPLEQWRAEGEAQELPKIVRLLSRIAQAHTPDFVRHTLSLDGKYLVSLQDFRDEPEREHVVTAQPLQVLDWSRLPVSPNAPSELVLAGNAQANTQASLPIRRRTYIPPLGPFPILPDEMSTAQQTILLNLEETLSRHTRVLVETSQTAGVDAAGLLLTFMDRVLQYTPVERILVLAGTTQLLAHLCQRYRTWVSLEDGVPLSERYAAQYKPTVAPDTQICFSSIREMQLAIRSLREPQTALCRQTYDLILVYHLAQLSALWQQVLAYFDASYYVGFGSASDSLITGLFDHNIIVSEADSQVSEHTNHFQVIRTQGNVLDQASVNR